jgi:hypothetical protein
LRGYLRFVDQPVEIGSRAVGRVAREPIPVVDKSKREDARCHFLPLFSGRQTASTVMREQLLQFGVVIVFGALRFGCGCLAAFMND